MSSLGLVVIDFLPVFHSWNLTSESATAFAQFEWNTLRCLVPTKNFRFLSSVSFVVKWRCWWDKMLWLYGTIKYIIDEVQKNLLIKSLILSLRLMILAKKYCEFAHSVQKSMCNIRNWFENIKTCYSALSLDTRKKRGTVSWPSKRSSQPSTDIIREKLFLICCI